MAMTMPRITKCEMTECSYNKNSECHAMAITVGGSHPMCDTFMKASRKGGVADMTGGVGACKVEDCRFNSMFECSASGINVAIHSGHADCATYSPR